MRTLIIAAALGGVSVHARFAITDIACDPMTDSRARVWDKMRDAVIGVSKWLLNPHKTNPAQGAEVNGAVNDLIGMSRDLELDPIGIGLSDCAIGHASLMLAIGSITPENDYARDSAYDVMLGFLSDGPDWPQVLRSEWPLFPLLDFFATVLQEDGYGFNAISSDDRDVGTPGCGGQPIQSIVDFIPGANETVAARYWEDLTTTGLPFPEPPTRLRPCTDMHVSMDPWSPHVCVWGEAARAAHLLLDRLDKSTSLEDGFSPERAHHSMMLVRSQLREQPCQCVLGFGECDRSVVVTMPWARVLWRILGRAQDRIAALSNRLYEQVGMQIAQALKLDARGLAAFQEALAGKLEDGHAETLLPLYRPTDAFPNFGDFASGGCDSGHCRKVDLLLS